MALTHDNYEQVARFLDGEPVSLTPQQRALADEIIAAERSLGAKLDADLPDRMLHRIHECVLAELPRHRSAWRWLRWVPAAAVAAAVVISVLLHRQPAKPAPPLGEAEYVQAFLDVPETGLEAEVQVLSDELAERHVDLALGEAVPLEIAVDGLEQELGETADEPVPDLWELLEDSL